jgi:hypothetical protein
MLKYKPILDMNFDTISKKFLGITRAHEKAPNPNGKLSKIIKRSRLPSKFLIVISF